MEPVTSFVGLVVGGLMRLAPEVVKIFTAKRDQDHEYRMTTLQLDIDKNRGQMDLDKVHANQALAAVQGEMAAYTEAVRGQGRMTGVPWVDAVNQTVRPFLTYWWMLLFTVHKVVIIFSVKSFVELKQALWTENDDGILSMIVGFWFVDRAIKYIRA